jgi:hypothetical protein
MNKSTTKTQRDRILAQLVEAGDAGVPSYELARVALQYGSRLKELRGQGHTIISRVKTVDGQKHGTFRLVVETAKKPIQGAAPSTAAMFSEPLVARMD